jgi:hypothetical protein
LLCGIYVRNAGVIYGYARVSTDDQSVAAQVAALQAAGASKVFREVASGTQTDRAQLRKAVDALGPVPNIPADRILECQKYLEEGSHRRLYRFSPSDYAEMAGVWGNGERALPGDPPGELTVVDGLPEGGKIHDLTGVASAFAPDYAPEEMFEIATKLYQASR